MIMATFCRKCSHMIVIFTLIGGCLTRLIYLFFYSLLNLMIGVNRKPIFDSHTATPSPVFNNTTLHHPGPPQCYPSPPALTLNNTMLVAVMELGRKGKMRMRMRMRFSIPSSMNEKPNDWISWTRHKNTFPFLISFPFLSYSFLSPLISSYWMDVQYMQNGTRDNIPFISLASQSLV